MDCTKLLDCLAKRSERLAEHFKLYLESCTSGKELFELAKKAGSKGTLRLLQNLGHNDVLSKHDVYIDLMDLPP